MIIIPNQRFLDERDEFLPDQEYDVENEKAFYYAKNGWADIKGWDEMVERLYPSKDTDLDIQDAKLGVESQNG